jgi:anaerobic magnesium-protoporphyrin IX monomethyl ester cyclase
MRLTKCFKLSKITSSPRIAGKMSKVLLINPKGSELASHGNSQVPVGYLYLAAECLRLGHQVRFVDGIISSNREIRDSFKWNPDIIGIQCLTIRRKQSFDLVRLARKFCPSSRIIMGGPHPSSCRQQVLDNYPVDDVCVGEGEKWIASYVEIGQGTNETYDNLDDIPFPAWELVDFRQYCSHFKPAYGLKAWVVFSRSCSWSCSFCSVWSIWGKYRTRSPQNFLEELRYLYYHRKVEQFNFVDDNTTQDREAIMGACEAIIRDGMKIKFHFLTRVDCVDLELLKALRTAGCHQIDYGVESGHPTILKNVHKDANKDISDYPKKCEKAIRETKEAGIATTALAMIGNKGESHETIFTTRRFLRKIKPTHIHPFRGVYLLPQTALFQLAKRENYLTDECWLDEDKTYFYPFPKWKLIFWHMVLASANWKTLKRFIMNFVKQRQLTGMLRRWIFIQARKRFL